MTFDLHISPRLNLILDLNEVIYYSERIYFITILGIEKKYIISGFYVTKETNGYQIWEGIEHEVGFIPLEYINSRDEALKRAVIFSETHKEALFKRLKKEGHPKEEEF